MPDSSRAMRTWLPVRGNTVRQIAIFLLGLLLAATTARAEWLVASSDHFVIYGDQREEAIREFAARLERLHAGMSVVLGRPQVKPSPSNRVTIYIVSNTAEVRDVTNMSSRYVAGVYRARAGGSIAVVPQLTGARSEYELPAATVLYHEYAHHFMWSGTARAYPRWFSEGFAEYFAGVRFKSDGSVAFGAPSSHRAAEYAYAREVPIRELLEFNGGKAGGLGGDSFYSRSGILFHYLQTAPERSGQLARYQQLLAQGDSPLEAAEGAFGDLGRLEANMEDYAGRRRVATLVVNGEALQVGPIEVRRLRPGEADMMPVVVRSKAGVDRDAAAALLPDAQRIAARHPGDAAVLAALAEAEFDAGNDDAAIAAADRSLAIDPQQINAHIQKGYALTRKAGDGKLPDGAWKQVRAQWIKANKLENDHPIPLVQYYASFAAEGQRPPKSAVDGLEWAMQLAPFDPGVRWLVASQMIEDQRYDTAVAVLRPLAYSPHPGEQTAAALKLLGEAEAKAAAAAPEVTAAE